MKKQQGFTLIELMIVIAILGILLAIAIPAYSDYTIRAKVSECVNMAASAKSAVSEYRLSNGAYPTSNALAGVPDPMASEYCEAVTVGAAGVISAQFRAIDAAVNGKNITFTPTDAANNAGVDWRCGGGTSTVDDRYVPSSCR